MTLFLAAIIAAQCGPRGCGPDGSSPSMFQYVQQPYFIQQPQTFVIQQPPAVVPVDTDNCVQGKVLRAWVEPGEIVRIELRHDDGQSFIYGFPWNQDAAFVNDTMQKGIQPSAVAGICGQQKLTARLSLDAANQNTVSKVEIYGYTPSYGGVPQPHLRVDGPKPKAKTPPGTGAKAAAAKPDCNCVDCKCDPCRCGSKGIAAKPQGCSNPACKCDGCKCGSCECGSATLTTTRAKGNDTAKGTHRVGLPDKEIENLEKGFFQPVGQVAKPHSAAIEAIPHNDDPLSGIPNFGIDTAKMQESRGRQRYTTNGGREISKKQCNDMLDAGADGVPDDSKHLFLTTIGTPEQQNAVKAVVDANPAVFDKIRCKFYLPTDDMVKDKGFASGSPSINLQSETGKVLMRFESMPDPPKLVGEVNKRRPDYDPNKDPTPDKPGPSPKPDPNQPANPLSQIPWWAWALAAALLFTRKS